MKWTNVEVKGNRQLKLPTDYQVSKGLSLGAASLSDVAKGGSQWGLSKGLVLAPNMAQGSRGAGFDDLDGVDIDYPPAIVAGPHDISKGLSFSGETVIQVIESVGDLFNLSKGLRLSGESLVSVNNPHLPFDFLVSKGLALSAGSPVLGQTVRPSHISKGLSFSAEDLSFGRVDPETPPRSLSKGLSFSAENLGRSSLDEVTSHTFSKGLTLSGEDLAAAIAQAVHLTRVFSKGLSLSAEDLTVSIIRQVANVHGLSKGLGLSAEDLAVVNTEDVVPRSLSKGLALSAEDLVSGRTTKLSNTSYLSKGLSLSAEDLTGANTQVVTEHLLSKGLGLSAEDLADILLVAIANQTVEQTIAIIANYSSSVITNRDR